MNQLKIEFLKFKESVKNLNINSLEILNQIDILEYLILKSDKSNISNIINEKNKNLLDQIDDIELKLKNKK